MLKNGVDAVWETEVLEGEGLLPGPTFYFQGGDLLQMTLNNLLSDERFDELASFEELEATDSNLETDVGVTTMGEINLPHNINNTNLYTRNPIHMYTTEKVGRRPTTSTNHLNYLLTTLFIPPKNNLYPLR